MKKINIVIITIIVMLWQIIACSKDSSNSSSSDSETGTGGSTARFTISGDYLYTVNSSSLQVFNLSNPEQPVNTSEINVGFGIETIFPYEQNLFIGAQTGMYIYDISTPVPRKLSQYEHIYSCDPVVVQGNYAYVTLHSEDSWCGRTTNELQIVDVSNLHNPHFLMSYPMTSPRGLSVNDTILYLCDNGLKVYDISNISNIKLKDYFSIEAIDVISKGDLLFVIGDNGLYQFRYLDGELNLLSTILAQNKDI